MYNGIRPSSLCSQPFVYPICHSQLLSRLFLTIGQTGSGKTYTMQGSQDNEGVTFRALRTLLETQDSASRTCDIALSALEIHRECQWGRRVCGYRLGPPCWLDCAI